MNPQVELSETPVRVFGMKEKITGTLRINAYAVLSRAVEEGVAFGYRRAHKHTDKPDEEALAQAIGQAVMDAISEVFDFDE